jgi:hypothetical protein
VDEAASKSKRLQTWHSMFRICYYGKLLGSNGGATKETGKYQNSWCSLEYENLIKPQATSHKSASLPSFSREAFRAANTGPLELRQTADLPQKTKTTQQTLHNPCIFQFKTNGTEQKSLLLKQTR